MTWTTQKPTLDHECILLLCDSDNTVTAYNIKKSLGDPPEGTAQNYETEYYYWGIFDNYDDETYYEDIESKYYAIIELPKELK